MDGDERDIITNDDDESANQLVRDIYLASAEKSLDREPVYNRTLGLAVEMLEENITIEQLWKVVN